MTTNFPYISYHDGEQYINIKLDYVDNKIIVNFKYNIEDFEEISDLKFYLTQCIKKLGICDSLKDKSPEMFLFFFNLFQRHPRKIDKEVDKICDIQIKLFPKVPKNRDRRSSDYQFWFTKTDGNIDSISWVSCANDCKYPVHVELTRAMRVAINYQIHNFRIKNYDKPCEICFSVKNLTVDHIILFEKLKSDFLKLYPDHPNDFAKNKIKQNCFHEKDIYYTTLWRNYHRKYAKLRILCESCNIEEDNKRRVNEGKKLFIYDKIYQTFKL